MQALNGKPLQRRERRRFVGRALEHLFDTDDRENNNGDAWVVFPALRAMHAGDIVSGKNIPGLDAVNGGSGLAIAETLTKAADTVKNIDTIITGHSSTMTVADLRDVRAVQS